MKLKLVVASLAFALCASNAMAFNFPRIINTATGFKQIRFTICMGKFNHNKVPIVELVAAHLNREFIQLNQGYCQEQSFPGHGGTVSVQVSGETYGVSPGQTVTVCQGDGGYYLSNGEMRC